MKDQTVYGGQAVIEGVMMRGPRFFAVACRKPDGSILVQQEEVPAFFTRYRWARWPFLRGVFALADALVLGMKTLLFSANLQMTEGQKPAAAVDPLTNALLAPLYLLLGVDLPRSSISGIAVTGSMVFGLGLGICLFMLFPSLLAGWLTPWVGTGIWPRLIEGGVRVVIVLGYIWGIGRMPHAQRLFQYHGAEHQAINALETEGRVDVEAAARASRIHPRCGTNFVLTVLLVKALIFTAIPFQSSVALRLGLRLLMLPVVASIAYEVIRLAGTYRNVKWLQLLVAPGILTQYLTTRVPGPEMVEVAVASLRAVMEREGTLPGVKQEPAPNIV